MSANPQPAPEPEQPLRDAEGTGRVLLRFLPDGTEVRVPSGTAIFDAASWNGVAIDSTCGGHGTCRKCKVQVLKGDVPVSSVDPRAFSVEELRDGWRLACRAPAREVVDSVRAADLLLGHDEWGARWIAAHRERVAQEAAAGS